MLRNIGSPTLARTENTVSYQINVETILSWPVFRGPNAPQGLDLKQLLQRSGSYAELPSLSVAADFEVNGAVDLFERFLESVHILNPVLEDVKIREYIRNARFNGLGWDAKSCLLVSRNFDWTILQTDMF